MERASEIVQPDDVIRFVALSLLQGTGPSGEEEFLLAWREAVERGPRLPGLAYRDLCRQVPAWNQQISTEIQHPNPFSFIDYAILRAGTDPAAVPVPPAAAITGFERTAGLYRVAAHVLRREAAGEPEMVLYKLFEVHGPPAVEERFSAGWPLRAEYQSHQPGFFSAMLIESQEVV